MKIVKGINKDKIILEYNKKSKIYWDMIYPEKHGIDIMVLLKDGKRFYFNKELQEIESISISVRS